MDDMIEVRRAVDRLLEGAPGPMLDLLADDVEFQVTTGGDTPDCRTGSGKAAVGDYFTALGGLVAFWQIDYTATGERVIAWGRESFTVQGCGLEGGCEFALVFGLSASKITRFQVIEDLPSFFRDGGSLVEDSIVAGWDPPGPWVDRLVAGRAVARSRICRPMVSLSEPGSHPERSEAGIRLLKSPSLRSG